MVPRKKAVQPQNIPAITPDAESAEVILAQLEAQQAADSVPAVLVSNSGFDKRTVIFASLLGGASLYQGLSDEIIEARMARCLKIADIAVSLLEKGND